MQLESILSEIDEFTQTVKTAAPTAVATDEISILIEKLAAAADTWSPTPDSVEVAQKPIDPQQQVIDKIAGSQALSATLDLLSPEKFKPMVAFLKSATAKGYSTQDAMNFFLEQQGRGY